LGLAEWVKRERNYFATVCRISRLHHKFESNISLNRHQIKLGTNRESASSGAKVIAVEANPALCGDLRERFLSEIKSGQLIIVNKAIMTPKGDALC
jgi:hypothetical protein